MIIINVKLIYDSIKRHPDAKSQLNVFLKVAGKATWKSIVEVRETYSHADAVGSCTVFNVKGNHYRLVVKIDYQAQIINIRNVLTHAEYDKEKWKNDCSS